MKWTEQSYEDATWEPENLLKASESGARALQEFYRLAETTDARRNLVEGSSAQIQGEEKKQFQLPELPGKLYPFQRKGVEFLFNAWAEKKHSSILAGTCCEKREGNMFQTILDLERQSKPSHTSCLFAKPKEITLRTNLFSLSPNQPPIG